MKPMLRILAGPNGAGKSSYTIYHVPADTVIFNGDLIFANYKSKFPTLGNDQIAGAVTKKLEDLMQEAIVLNKDFAFETNFSNDLVLDLMDTFKKFNYTTVLLYFGLNTLNHSGNRVNARVASGGHYVTRSAIRYNFTQGLKQVLANLPLFDQVSFIDTNTCDAAPIIARFDKMIPGFIVFDENIPWFNEHFRDELFSLTS